MTARVASAGTAPNGVELFHVVCDQHPSFRRVPWTGETVPQESADKHNAQFHPTAAA